MGREPHRTLAGAASSVVDDIFDSRRVEVFDRTETKSLMTATVWYRPCYCRGMLKITVNDSETRRLLVLEGKLVAPWTNELRRFFQRSGSDPDQRELIIDVGGVTVVSTDGEETLLWLMVRGAKFRKSGVYMRQVLKQLARRVRRNEQG
jgi:hypothetical protein